MDMPDFDIRPEELCVFMETVIKEKGSIEVLEREFNGIMGLAMRLRVDMGLGLTSAHDVTSRFHHFGSNQHEDSHMRSWRAAACHALHDGSTLLLVAVVVALFVLGVVRESSGTTSEAVALAISVLLLVVVAAANDRDREQKLAVLNEMLHDVEIGVRRNGQVVACHVDQLVVGDIVEVICFFVPFHSE